jgi:hypothetical protein
MAKSLLQRLAEAKGKPAVEECEVKPKVTKKKPDAKKGK